MKTKERKPTYFRYFARKLLPCLITAVLVGVSCTAGLYAVRYQSVRNQFRKIYSDLVMQYQDADITQMTHDDVCFPSAHRVSNDGDVEYIDMAFSLERKDTGEIFDSAPMFCAVTEDGNVYYSHDEALMALYETYLSIEEKHSLSRDNFDFLVQDIYIKDGSDEFLPGNVDIIRTPYGSGSEEVLGHSDLTPEHTDGYRHFRRGGSLEICSMVGNSLHSEALELVRSPDAGELSHGRLIAPPGEPLEVIVDMEKTLFCSNGEGILCTMRGAMYYHFWKEQRWRLLAGYSLLLAFVVLIAAVGAVFSCAKAKRRFEMDAYRRDLTNILAHDLKSPLTAITGYAENLRSGMHRKKQDYYTDAILQNAQYMDNIISDVLALSVLEETPSIAAQSTDIMQLVQEAFAQYAPELAERHISLAIGGNCTVLADRRMMAQAAANLVSNAVRCTPCRGAITVSGSEGLLTISNDCTEITDAADLAEPFVKGDAARSGRRGSGLGLSIVRQILRLHHAALVLDVRDGKFIAEMRFSD